MTVCVDWRATPGQRLSAAAGRPGAECAVNFPVTPARREAGRSARRLPAAETPRGRGASGVCATSLGTRLDLVRINFGVMRIDFKREKICLTYIIFFSMSYLIFVLFSDIFNFLENK